MIKQFVEFFKLSWSLLVWTWPPTHTFRPRIVSAELPKLVPESPRKSPATAALLLKSTKLRIVRNLKQLVGEKKIHYFLSPWLMRIQVGEPPLSIKTSLWVIYLESFCVDLEKRSEFCLDCCRRSLVGSCIYTGRYNWYAIKTNNNKFNVLIALKYL